MLRNVKLLKKQIWDRISSDVRIKNDVRIKLKLKHFKIFQFGSKEYGLSNYQGYRGVGRKDN